MSVQGIDKEKELPKTAPLEVPAWMLDAAACRVFRQGPSGQVTVEALRWLRRTLDAAANVIEAQHQLIAFGGSDAPLNEDSKDAYVVMADTGFEHVKPVSAQGNSTRNLFLADLRLVFRFLG